MITVFLVFYAFVAGLMAEYSHTRLSNNCQPDVIISSLVNGVIWPVAMWKEMK